MENKIQTHFLFMNNKLRQLVIGMMNFLIIALISTAHLSASAVYENNVYENNMQDRTVTGVVTEAGSNYPLAGANVMIEGTAIGTVTDRDGNYSIDVPGPDAVLVFSYIGYVRQTVVVGDQTEINLSLAPDIAALDEMVVVGYGTQRRVNTTGAVSAIGNQEIEHRPISNVQQALQGLVPNLVIQPTRAGGEPGSDMAMNIRGLTSFEGSNAPYVLVDGVPMGINDVNPNDIESISVLKDAASTAIYGARAAYGVILITTKRGEIGTRATYSTNFSSSRPTVWPERAETMFFIHTMNESSFNAGGPGFYDADAIRRLEMNRENPGSAPSLMPRPGGQSWDVMNTGMKATAWVDWDDVLINRTAPKIKHDLSVSGGSENLNYYFSGSYFDEKGLLKVGNESFNRYNVDTKIDARVNDWMRVSFTGKFRQHYEDFPWNDHSGRAWIMNWISKIKPGLPVTYDGTDIYTTESRIGQWQAQREVRNNKQFVASPRITIEKPIKGWVTNIQLNYIQNNEHYNTNNTQTPWVTPSGDIAFNPQIRENTASTNNLYTNVYFSPTVYTTYTTNLGSHNIDLLAGAQQELYEYNNVLANSTHLLSDAIPSIRTSVGEKQVQDQLGHWSTRSFFGRVNYNYQEKYLLEVNVRADGSSRFDEGDRWGTFPSLSAGWVLTNETFFPEIRSLDEFKIRASYGTLGNQNVANYLYIPTLGVRQTNQWLFGNDRAWVVGAPNLTSVNLTWEKVTTLDIGIDAMFLDNRLGIVLDWYQSNTTDLVGPGEALPALLGTGVPRRNEGEIQTRGWEVELSWRNSVSRDFSYGIRGVLSDYTSTVVSYNNPNRLLNTFYDGQILGEIWGFRTDGLFQTEEELANYPIDQREIWSGTWRTGDLKYVDLTGDGRITRGDNTADDPGDREVIGNSTPRYMFGVSGNVNWKNFDMSVLFQGVGSRQVWIASASPFRGPANGPMHSGVYKEHRDYFRDDTSVLGANPDAYFARPYAQFMGENHKNYGWGSVNDRYLQDASFVRVKNVTIGYTLPDSLTERFFINSARFYVSGENLFTVTGMMIFDPEAFGGRWYNGGDAYPLSKNYSLGLIVNF